MADLSHCYNIADLRNAARRRLPKGIFEYIDRGSEDEVALRRNREAFERLMLETSFMVDLAGRDLGLTLFGERSELPVAIAPTGVAGLCWYQGEMALAKAAAKAGVPFTLAMGSITAMEQIAREVDGRRWFQIYMWRETEHTFEMVRRAAELGYEALVVTIDSALGRTREHNARNGFTIPFRLNPRSTTDLALHPGWLLGVMGRYLTTTGMPHHENYPRQYRQVFRIRPGGGEPPRYEGMTWDDISRLRDMWPRKLIVKSTLSAAEASEAVNRGADAVVVSNHGGRAMDSARPPIDVLPEVVAAVGDRADVLLDSGIRRGSDIVKALALGAKTVLIGRATLYGIGAGGEPGAALALGILRNEFEKTMGYLGARNVGELGPHQVFRQDGTPCAALAAPGDMAAPRPKVAQAS